MLRQGTERGPVRHAYQVMTRNVLTLRPGDTVAAAWRALTSRHVRQAPVLSSSMDIVGLVSERDLLTVIDLQGDALTGWLDRTVSEVMISPVVCADPVTDIRRIAHVLLKTGLSALPIAGEARELLGIVSRGDILRAVVSDPPLSLWI
jgi:CBS domain-containing protein